MLKKLALILALAIITAAQAESLPVEEIYALEQQLYAAGYHSEQFDARIEGETAFALRAFQKANGLNVTGMPDKATRRLLESGNGVTCHDCLTDLANNYAARPGLQAGASGKNVSSLQLRLKALGYFSGSADGVYGDATHCAVEEYQIAAGLPATGIADSATQFRLFEGLSPTKDEYAAQAAVQTGDNGMKVRTLQCRLSELGYFFGTPSGIYGEYTARAVSAFQEDCGFQPTGVADVEVCLKLYAHDAPYRRTASVSPETEDLQHRLTELHYFDKNITGVYGKTTETAVRLFQMACSLESDGLAEGETLNALNSGLAPAAESAVETFAAIRRTADAEAAAALAQDALALRGTAFSADDEDLYMGFAFVQGLAARRGLPVLHPADLEAEWSTDGSPQAGDILAFDQGQGLLFGICTGENRVAYATSTSGFVLESPIDRMAGRMHFRRTAHTQENT